MRRVRVSDPLFDGRRFDYIDAFVADGISTESESPRDWMRRGLRFGPDPARAVRRWLGQPPGSPDGLRGWRILASTPDFIHLEYDLPLMDVSVVGRNLSPSSRMVSTGLRYRQRALARVAWAAVGPLHRLLSRRLVAGRSTIRGR